MPGLWFAGDWVSLPFPATLLEGAAASGLLAANRVLAAAGPLALLACLSRAARLSAAEGRRRDGAQYCERLGDVLHRVHL